MKKILFTLTIVVVFAVFSVFIFINEIERIKITDADLYQYILGVRQSYTGDVEIKTNKEKSILKNNNKTVDLEPTPIYYGKEDKIFLPKTMAYIDYNTGTTKKVGRFSKVAKEEFSTISIQQRGDKKLYENFFLYDGLDTYVFTQEVKLLIGDTVMVLPPLSYVRCDYNKNLEVYFYENRNFQQFSVQDTKVSVKIEEGYEVDLNQDMLITPHTNQLLFKKVDTLSNLD